MSDYTINWNQPAAYCRTSRVAVVSETKIRFEFDNGNASEYDVPNAHGEATEWIARCRAKGATVEAV